MEDRFVLITDGTLEPRRFPIADMHDRYHRVKCYATSWTQGEALVDYLNRGSSDSQYWDQLRDEIEEEREKQARLYSHLEAETAANATEASMNDMDGPQP